MAPSAREFAIWENWKMLQRSGTSRPAFLAGLTLLVVVVLTACGSESTASPAPLRIPLTFGSPSPSASAISGTPTQSPLPPAAVVPDGQAVELMQLGPADLHGFEGAGAGYSWTTIRDQGVNVNLVGAGCAGVPHWTAEWDRQFSYGLMPNGGEHGHGELRTIAATTVAEAAAEAGTTTTPSYWACYEREHVGPDLAAEPGVRVTGSTTITPQTLGIAGATAVLYTTPYNFEGPKVQYRVVTWLVYQRYRAILDLQTCCSQPTTADIAPDATVLMQRMQELVAGKSVT